jgi:predicted aspartyl protease
VKRALAFATALVALAVSAAGTAPAQQTALDEAAIRAKVKEAVGEYAESYREVDDIAYSNGTSTTEHDYRRGKDFRYVFDSGPLHTEQGSYHGEVWYMNANGQVVFDDPADPDGPADADAPKAVVTRIQAPVDGYLLARLDARGRGVKEYVDATTWQLVRRERVTPRGTVVRTYEDVRADHGRTFPHHIHIENPVDKLNSDLRIVSYEPGEVSDAEVALPDPRRRLVEFPESSDAVEIPSRFAGTQVYVRVTINGRGLDFTLDTGADGITIDNDVARELGLKQFGRETAFAAGRYDIANAIVPEMHAGPLTMRNVAVQIVPQGWEEAPNLKDVGLLGFDFIAELGLTIDYEHKRVTAVPGTAFHAPTDPLTFALDVHVGGGTPRVPVAVNGVVAKHFLLDTGGDGSFMIANRFARRHPEAFKNQTPYGAPHIFQGIGGLFAVQPYKMSSVKLANLNLRDWIGYRIVTNAYDADDFDGLIGGEFLRLFTVHLDYVNSRVYLVPNREGRNAMGLK